MALKRVSGPAVEPLTLAEAKAHLRVDHTVDDALITELIKAAREHAEGYLKRVLITQVWQWKRDGFGHHALELPLSAAQSVDSIQYVDSAGVTQTWAAANYQVDLDSEPGRVSPAFGYQWPLPDTRFNAVIITFTVGYGAAGSSVPAPIKQALLLHIGHMHERREQTISGTIIAEIPMGYEALMFPYRVWM